MNTLHNLLEDDTVETVLTAAELRQLLVDSISEMNDGANDD